MGRRRRSTFAYRHPSQLARIVATLDVLSGGRAQLAIGAAWYEREHNGLGVPYPPLGTSRRHRAAGHRTGEQPQCSGG